MSVSTEQLIFELHISRTDKGVYMWTTIYGGGEMLGESDEPENSIEGCLLAASKEIAILYFAYPPWRLI